MDDASGKANTRNIIKPGSTQALTISVPFILPGLFTFIFLHIRGVLLCLWRISLCHESLCAAPVRILPAPARVPALMALFLK